MSLGGYVELIGLFNLDTCKLYVTFKLQGGDALLIVTDGSGINLPPKCSYISLAVVREHSIKRAIWTIINIGLTVKWKFPPVVIIVWLNAIGLFKARLPSNFFPIRSDMRKFLAKLIISLTNVIFFGITDLLFQNVCSRHTSQRKNMYFLVRKWWWMVKF